MAGLFEVNFPILLHHFPVDLHILRLDVHLGGPGDAEELSNLMQSDLWTLVHGGQGSDHLQLILGLGAAGARLGLGLIGGLELGLDEWRLLHHAAGRDGFLDLVALVALARPAEHVVDLDVASALRRAVVVCS